MEKMRESENTNKLTLRRDRISLKISNDLLFIHYCLTFLSIVQKIDESIQFS